MEGTKSAPYVRKPATIDVNPLRSLAIVAIDGDNGAGKSYMGKELAECLGGQHVEVDDFLLGEGVPYLQQLDKARLITHLDGIQRYPAVVEGILLLDVFDVLRISHDYLIFTKCFINGVRELERYLLPSAKPPCSKTTREITEYYRRWRPWLKANLTVELYVRVSR